MTLNNENKNNNEIKDNKKESEDKTILKTEKDNTNNPFSILVKDTNNKKDDKNDKNEGNEKKSLFEDIFKKNDKKESLFGNFINNNTNNTKSLFGIPINTDNKEKNALNNDDNNESKEQNNQPLSLFGNIPLISKDNNKTNEQKFSLFGNNSGKSLFTNNENENKPTSLLFSDLNNNNNSTFLQIKGNDFAQSLFANKTENKKNDNSEKKGTLFEGDEDSEKSDEQDKPKTNYVAEPLKAQDYSEYSKFFNLNINNLFLYNKIEKKYVSKGSGFFSIEKTKDEKSEKPKVVVVFRNHAGNKLVEGFLDNKFKKFDILSKDFNFVVYFGIILIKYGKPEIGSIKIPFKGEDTANELKAAFEKGIDILEKQNI